MKVYLATNYIKLFWYFVYRACWQYVNNTKLTHTQRRTTSTTPRIHQGRLHKVVEILLILIYFKYKTNDKKIKLF
jgi:hypothetical protein